LKFPKKNDVKKTIALFCFSLVMIPAFSQADSIDALLNRLGAEKNDNNRIDLINEFLSYTSEVDPVLDMRNSQKILLYAQKNEDKISEAMALTEIGYDYRAFGNTEKSLEYGLKAHALAAQTGNEKLVANAKLTLAHNYKDQAEYGKAIGMYMSVAKYATSSGDYLLQTWAFASMGEIYIQVNKLDSALMYAQRAYELCLQHHNGDFISNTLRHLGRIQGRMGNAALAVSYFEMAIKEAQRINSKRWISESYTALAQYYYETGQTDSSIVYARKAIATVENSVFSNKAIKPAKLLLDIYENTNSDSAIKYFKIYKTANDSLFSAKRIQQTQVMTFENEVRQQELAAEKIKAGEQRKKDIQYALISLCIVSFIIFFLLFSRTVVANEKWISFFGVVALLIVFEFLNLLLHPFLERVTNHSPVLILLGLVCIGALLVPLHHKLEKWAKTRLVEKNKLIRLAAAKKTIEQLEGNSEKA
jgi:tetratricopeptide (TPR) repeat protein